MAACFAFLYLGNKKSSDVRFRKQCQTFELIWIDKGNNNEKILIGLPIVEQQ
jgi:hypothetical protein